MNIRPFPSRAPEAAETEVLLKVPEITAYFWIVKLLSTAMGEATSDYFVLDVNRYLGVVLGFVGLTVALVLQFKARGYNAWIYWFAVTMVAVFGTMAADVLHVVIGVPTGIYSVLLACLASSSSPGTPARRPCRSIPSSPDAARCSTGQR